MQIDFVMKKSLILSILCVYGGLFVVQAQTVSNPSLSERVKKMEQIALQYEDSLLVLATENQKDTEALPTDGMNPRYYRLFAKPTLYASCVSNALKMSDENQEGYAVSEPEYLELSPNSDVNHSDKIEHEIDRTILATSLSSPELFAYTEDQIMAEQVVSTDAVAQLAPTANIITRQEVLDDEVEAMNIEVKRPNFWKTSGSASLQFTQNYISENWYKGGESTNTLVSELILKANYNDQQHIQWDNTLEAKLGFTTAPSDTMHKYRTNTDLLRLSSKLGVKAFKSWFYTIEVESKTQMLKNYKVNSDILQSAFTAPLETTVGIGMDYKKDLKNFNISVNLAPLAYRWVYVGNDDVDETKFGVEKDEKSLQEYGSSMKVKSTWTIIKNVTWTSRLEAFTNYEKVQAEWENTFDFAISRYLSTKLFLHGRFDDGVPRMEDHSYFQFKEFLSFGLSYKW